MKASMTCGLVFVAACGTQPSAELTATQQASTQVTVSHQVQVGRDASLSWYVLNQTSQTNLSLDAFEIASRGIGGASAMLSFGSFTIDPSTEDYSSVVTFAPLPSGALQISPDARSASLNTTTGPDATTITCTGQIDVGQTCTTASSPPVSFSVTWSSNGLFHAFSSGTAESIMPGFTFRNQGTSTSTAANASGILADSPVPSGAAAWINDSNSTSLIRDVVQNQP